MENTYILSSNGELYHHGVKGMKWGVRRYQDKSGRLTAAGRNRSTVYGGSKGSASAQKTSNSNNSKRTVEELQEEIDLRRLANTERGQAAAVGALFSAGALGINAVSAVTTGIIELKSTALGVVGLGASAVGGAMTAVEAIKIKSLEKQLAERKNAK